MMFSLGTGIANKSRQLVREKADHSLDVGFEEIFKLFA